LLEFEIELEFIWSLKFENQQWMEREKASMKKFLRYDIMVRDRPLWRTR